MMILPFAATVHLLLYPNQAEEKDRRSFSCRFKSGQEHQKHANLPVESP